MTNIRSGLFWQSSRFTASAIGAGELFSARSLREYSTAIRTRLLARAMNIAAGAPLPETSPTRKQNRCAEAQKQS